MNQNSLYLLVGALAVIVVALGIYVYQQNSEPDGVEIKIGDKGISVETN